MQFITKIIYFLFVTFLCGCFFILGLAFWLAHHDEWLDLEKFQQVSEHHATIVLDDAGNELFRFSKDQRQPLHYSEIPQTVIDAFRAAEDHLFFEHHGVSWQGIIRSLTVNIKKGRVVQGASTITQQLVKLIFTDGKRTFQRKVKEQVLALIIECMYSKQQILESYLNVVCFGCGIYGIAAASEIFWGCKPQDLSYDQAATLAAIVKSPRAYCPLIHRDAALKRRNVVLDCMVRQGFLDGARAQEFKQKPLELKEQKQTISLHIREMVRLQLERIIGKQSLYTDGFVVQTTFNRSMQEHAEKTFKRYITAFRADYKQEIDGALISIQGATGAIKACVGGYDFNISQFNRVYAQRQLGSVFKPLIYCAALQKGYTLQDIEIDEPLSLPQGTGTWNPHNVNKKFEGPMTRAYALMRSNNIISIKTLLQAGLDTVAQLARACHLKLPEQVYPSLALGCLECTPLSAVAFFNCFAQRGTYVEPFIIAWVKDRYDNKIYKHEPIPEMVIDWESQSKIARVLECAMDTTVFARYPNIIDSKAIIKTGTATKATSCWLAGATPEHTTMVYIGRDDNKSMGNNVFAVRTALPIWLDYHKKVSCKQKTFSYAPQLKEITINALTGSRYYTQNDKIVKILN